MIAAGDLPYDGSVVPEWTRVVVGYDGRDESGDALRLGKALAAVANAELQVAVVLPRGEVPFERAVAGGQLAEQLDDQLFEEVTNALGGTSFTPVRLDGGLGGRSAARALYEYARDQAADLIVVGSTHRGPLGRVFPGSVGESLLGNAPCAVAVAPRGFARGEHAPIGLIGAAYDGTDESTIALTEAQLLARSVGARLRVVTVIPELSLIDIEAMRMEELHAPIRHEYRGILEKGVSAVSGEIPVEAVLEEGDPAAVLAEHGVELDLIVIGSRGYGRIRGTLLGGVSAKMIRTAPCPVLVTPRASAGAESAAGADLE